MMHVECPSNDDLLRFAGGNLPDDDADRIADHTEHCSHCAAVLDSADPSNQNLLDGLKTAPAAGSPDPHLARLLARAKAIVLGDQPGAGPPASASRPLAPTELGDYQLGQPIGRGGMGTVFEAIHTRLKRRVAVKILAFDRLRNAEAVDRFGREMEAIGRLEHPNLVRALDARETDGICYLVMELVEGADVGRLLDERGPLMVADACELARQAAQGLDYTHQRGLVHRDIKPSNLMVDTQGVVKILDLGLALVSGPSAEGLTTSGAMLGTLDYMAPEQADDSHGVDCRADIYSLGCTLYALLCGAAPFAGPRFGSPAKKIAAHSQATVPPLDDKRAGLPDDLVKLIERMLSKVAAGRPGSAAEVGRVLARWCEGADLASVVSLSARPAEAGVKPSMIDTPVLAASAKRDTPHTISNAKRAGAARPSFRRIRRRWLAALLPAVLLIWFLAIYMATNIPATDDGNRVLPGDVAAPRPEPQSAAQEVPSQPVDQNRSLPPLHGLAPRPAPLAGVRRWQLDTLAPRDQVHALAWSPDGRLAATSDVSHQTRIYDLAGKQVRLLHVLPLAAHRSLGLLEWSPDSRLLAVGGSEDAGIFVADTGRRLWGPEGGHQVECVAWSPDGQSLATSHRTGEIRLWSRTGRRQNVLRSHEGPSLCVAWSPDGTRLVSGGEDGTVRLWSADGEAQGVLRGHEGPVHLVGFDPDGSRVASSTTPRIATGSADTALVRLWDAHSGQPLVELQVANGNGDLVSMAWLGEGEQLATVRVSTGLQVWDPTTGTLIRGERESLDSLGYPLDWSPKGDRFLCLNRFPSFLSICLVETGEYTALMPWYLFLPHTTMQQVVFSPSSDRLATVGPASKLRFWSAEGEAADRGADAARAECINWCPERDIVATGAFRSVRLTEATSATLLDTLDDPTDEIYAVAFSPDGQTLVAGGRDRKLYVWDVASRRNKHVWEAGAVVSALGWSFDGRWLAVGTNERTLRLWNVDEGTFEELPLSAARGIAWMPQSRQLAAAFTPQVDSATTVTTFWDVDANRAVWTSADGQGFWSPAIRPDGRVIAGAIGPGLIFHDVRTGAVITRPAPPPVVMLWAAWSRNGDYLAAVAADKTLRLFDGKTFEPRWLAIELADEQVALVNSDGRLLTPLDQVEDHLFYLVEYDDGQRDLLQPGDFARRYGPQLEEQADGGP